MIVNKKNLASTRKMHCVSCGGGDWNMESGEWRNNAHHVTACGHGGGKRDDNNVVALCQKCHNLLHNYGKTFKELHGEKLYKELRGQK